MDVSDLGSIPAVTVNEWLDLEEQESGTAGGCSFRTSLGGLPMGDGFGLLITVGRLLPCCIV